MIPAEDEFADIPMLAEGIGVTVPSYVARRAWTADDGREISYIAWGNADPEVVLLHGGGQNAHTWDVIALLLERPLLAIDLPGHGRSSWRDDRDYWPWTNADSLGPMLREVAPRAKLLGGLSLGGLTSIRLAAIYPEIVKKLFVMDVTPGVNHQLQSMTDADRDATALVKSEPTVTTFEELVIAALLLSPTRTEEEIRRGVFHNARQREDGQWTWRYDDLVGPSHSKLERGPLQFEMLWADLEQIRCPVLLLLGGASKYVGPRDVDRFRKTAHDLIMETVPGAGHSIHSQQPREVTALLTAFIDA